MTDGDSPTERQIPVTLVSGFLGAGKTTLVNRMLRNADGLRLAVLVNDFGAVSIDAELIQGAVGNVVSLKNGCICCSLTGGLLAAISGVLRWPVPPDAIIVEGSGVANPLEVARALSDPELQRYAPLDGIVTVVDADGFDALDGEALALARQQVVTADLVLLNKTDLVDEATLVATESRLATLAPGTRIIRCAGADVPLPVLLGLAGTNVATGFAGPRPPRRKPSRASSSNGRPPSRCRGCTMCCHNCRTASIASKASFIWPSGRSNASSFRPRGAAPRSRSGNRGATIPPAAASCSSRPKARWMHPQ